MDTSSVGKEIKMKENEQSKIPVAILVFIIIQIVFIIFLAISISNLLEDDTKLKREDQPEITISNLKTLVSDLSDEYASDIQHSLTEIVELNTTNLGITDSSATIREESLNTVKSDYKGSKIISYIVDIPNLQQSYQMFYAYPINTNLGAPSTNNYRAILCLEDEKQIVYPDFECYSPFSSDARREIIGEYLGYFEFEYFSATLDDDNVTVIISPISESVTETTKKAYINQTKEAIKSLGISPDLFEYKVLTQADMTYYIE